MPVRLLAFPRASAVHEVPLTDALITLQHDVPYDDVEEGGCLLPARVVLRYTGVQTLILPTNLTNTEFRVISSNLFNFL